MRYSFQCCGERFSLPFFVSFLLGDRLGDSIRG
nr:MAG TPA: hypothetical protein [Caudoviricetes sp.]